MASCRHCDTQAKNLTDPVPPPSCCSQTTPENPITSIGSATTWTAPQPSQVTSVALIFLTPTSFLIPLAEVGTATSTLDVTELPVVVLTYATLKFIMIIEPRRLLGEVLDVIPRSRQLYTFLMQTGPMPAAMDLAVLSSRRHTQQRPVSLPSSATSATVMRFSALSLKIEPLS